MKILFRLFLPVLLILSVGELNAGENYTIKFRIKGIKDTTCMIAYYYINNTYVIDTLKVDGAGRFTYNPDTAKAFRGLYIAVINDKQYFEFVINNDHKFSIETDISDLIGKMVITNSPDNSLFYQYVKYNNRKYNEVQGLISVKKRIKDNKDSIALIDEKINTINKELINYKLDILKKYPESFTAVLIRIIREQDIPEAPVLSNGRRDSTFTYRYYKAHYWDGITFTDDRMLRTPVFYNKLKTYFDKIVPQIPDSITKEADLLIEKARPNYETYKYFVWFLTSHYENNEIMGMDKVFVHLVDTYYVTSQTPWVTKSNLEKIIKKSNQIKPLLLGSVPPNMMMLDTSNQVVSMYDVHAQVLIILFWDPDCGHCEKEIPRIKEFYDQNKDRFGVEIFAVCTDTTLSKWKNAIRKRGMNWINVNGPRSLTGNFHDQYDILTTPVIYILNRNKEIIAKRIDMQSIPGFIEDYLKKKDKN